MLYTTNLERNDNVTESKPIEYAIQGNRITQAESYPELVPGYAVGESCSVSLHLLKD